MAKKQTIEVRINRHTLSIGGQIYQLRNLARVQRWTLTPAWGRIASRVLRPAWIALVIVLVLDIYLVVTNNGTVPEPLPRFTVLAVLVIGLVTFARFAKDAFRRPEYVLLLETTGYPVGALSSTRSGVIQNLVDEIADAIENPPDRPKVIHVGDVVLGDQINQSGDSPVGKVLSGA